MREISVADAFISSPILVEEILLRLSAMALMHFFLNSVIVAAVVGFDLRKNVYGIWPENLLYASSICFAGAAMAGIVAVIAGPITAATLGIKVARAKILQVSLLEEEPVARQLELKSSDLS